MNADILWLETERFEHIGGWTRDAQFIDQMGSPYLLATGMGTPVEDATTRAAAPRAGTYRLWVRTKDWFPSHHPGRFRVLINGQEIEAEFGASGRAGWLWEDGGTFDLSQEVTVSLKDMTGYYGRCDALVLCSDADWMPPSDRRELDRLRERWGGVSPERKEAGEFDVVVVGGGLAGCMAAVASARQGAAVALIQNRPMLGGNASTEILVPPVGVWPWGDKRPGPLDPRETGLVGEIRTAGDQHWQEAKLYPQRLRRLAEAEPLVSLFLNTHATGVEQEEGSKSISSVLAVDVVSGQRLRFPGKLFVDCTGDSAVAYAAGADTRHGREARSEYNEPGAPEEGDGKTMGNSIKYVSLLEEEAQPFEAPPWAFQFPLCSDFAQGRHPRLGGSLDWQWMIELGGNRDTVADAEEIRDDLFRLVFGIWDHVKNHCPQYKEEAANHRLVWVGHVAGKRENRRVLGDYVLKQQDIVEQVLFPDRIAYGGWSLDDHHPDGFFHRGEPVRVEGNEQHRGRRYSIPYRCLYSRNVDNLMMAGRNISATHMGLSNTRVMMTCAVMGHAAGTAAGMCIERETSPRGIYEDHIQDLQQRLLKEGAYLIDLPNQDPFDLARKARIQASSFEDGLEPSQVIDGWSRAKGSSPSSWSPEDGGEAWISLRWDEPMSFNVCHLTFLTREHIPEDFVLEGAREEGWQVLADVEGSPHRRHTLTFDRIETEELRLTVIGGAPAVSEIRVYDEDEAGVALTKRAQATKHIPDDPVPLGWKLGRDPGAFPGLVLDCTQAKAKGSWVFSTYIRPVVGEGYYHDNNEGKGGKELTFQVELQPGQYELRLAYTRFQNRATNVPVRVDIGGHETTIIVDQTLPPDVNGKWHSLGVYEMLRKGEAAVTIGTAETDGYVIVDAVQFLPK